MEWMTELEDAKHSSILFHIMDSWIQKMADIKSSDTITPKSSSTNLSDMIEVWMESMNKTETKLTNEELVHFIDSVLA
jgi:hypothetical protein